MTNSNYPRMDMPFVHMKVNDSFFMPSIDIDADILLIMAEAQLAKVKIAYKPVIYRNMTGIRVWVTRINKR